MTPPGPSDRNVVPGSEPPQIGGYTIMRLIGHGGAGRVFAARDEQLGRTVAIKVLHPQVAADPKNVERFLREARAMATISSPHVAAIFQVGQHRNVPFIVMEYLEGENLEQRLKRERRIPVEEALLYVRDCALALKAASSKGIVHRDVKPANILVIDGRAKLTDFGTARPVDGSADMTMTGHIAGTAAFIAPERVTEKGDDPRSDIYSLGGTLYCLLCGEPPFVRASPIEVIGAHLKEEPVPLDEKVPGMSPRVAELVKRMMAKKPDRRFQKHEEIIAGIEALLRGQAGGFDESTEVLNAMASGGARTMERPEPTDPFAAANDPFAAANDPFGAPPSSSPPSFSSPANSMVGEPTGVMGTLKQMNIVDICHMLEMGKKDAEIELTSIEGQQGKLAFLGGQVVFCEWDNQLAEEGFYVLARRKEGFFRIHYGRRPSQQNISVPTAFLVLEAMRRLDEAERGGPPSPEPEPPPVVTRQRPLPLDAVVQAVVPPRPVAPPIAIHSGEFAPLGDSGSMPQIAPGLPAPPTTSGMGIRPAARATTQPGVARRPTPRTPAPIDGIAPTVPVPALRPEATMMMTPEEEARLREEVGGRPSLAARLAPLMRRARALVGAVNGALAPVGETVARPLEKTPLASAGDVMRRQPWIPVAGALCLGLLLAYVVVVIARGSGPEINLARIDGGDAAVVLGEIEAIPLEERTARQELLRGHALARLGRTEDALQAYHAASKLGVLDERALELALAQLEEPEPVAAMDLLVMHASDEVTQRLLERVTNESWAVRHNALLVLDERGQRDKIDLEAVAIQDLLTGPTCKQRRMGLLDLKKVGKTQAARDAFTKALLLKEGDNACMRTDFEAMAAPQ